MGNTLSGQLDVSAPCTGRVRYAVDGLPDSSIPSGDVLEPAGNDVAIDCAGKGVTVVLAHLRKGSRRPDSQATAPSRTFTFMLPAIPTNWVDAVSVSP